MTKPEESLALARGSRLPGWLLASFMLYGYFLVLIAIGGHMEWKHLGVPAIEPTFADLRGLTSAWQCTRDGVDVLPANPCDPLGPRPANYPRLWLLPSHLGLGEGSTLGLGLMTAVVFFASALLIVRPTSDYAGIYAAALVSPAVMLGVERANPDLIVFSLVAVALIGFCARTGSVRAVGHGVLLLAAALKLFPAFAFGVLLRQSRRWALSAGGVVVAAFSLYVVAIWGDVQTIRKVVPQEVWYSYGAGVGVDAVRQQLAPDAGGSDTLIEGVLITAALVAICAILWNRRTVARLIVRPPIRELRTEAFVAGAGMYCGSFLLMHNWDYRLIVLILVIPKLLDWFGDDVSAVPAPRLTLGCLLGTLWLSEPLSIHYPAYPVEEVLNWWLFVSLGCGLVILLAPAARAALAREPCRRVAGSASSDP